MLRVPKLGLRRPFFTALRKPNRWSYPLTVCSAIFVVVLIFLTKDRIPFDLSNLAFDWYQRLDHRTWNPDSPVRIVDIDNESLARFGQWPWPRSIIAEIISRLRELDAAVVATDVVFAEPDALSPDRLITLLPASQGRSLLEQEIKERASNDALLAEAIADTPTVLGAFLTQDGRAAEFPAKFGVATAGDDPQPFLTRFTSAVVPLPPLSSASAGLGALNWLPDRDHIVRRVPLILGLGEQIVPGLAVEALRLVQGASTLIVRSSNAMGQTAFGARTGVNMIKVGDYEIPTDAQGALRVNFTRSEPRRFIPAWKLLTGDVDPRDIQQRIIVLGISAAGLHDEQSTPVDSRVAGSEIHAQVLEQIIAGAWLRRPDWAPGVELLLAIALAFGIGALLPYSGALPGALVALAAVGLMALSSKHQFVANGVLVDPILPTVATSITYVFCLIWLYRTERRRRKFVREAFGHYVSAAVIERLAEDPAKLILGGETRVLTIMFCDVRGFTSLSERLDPQSLTQLMNEYLTAMTDAIIAHGGTIDKYIGDAIMAFWNAPLDEPKHASQAARAALAMIRELEIFNDRYRERALARGEKHADVKFGIGFVTGECCVGNFGSIHRFHYSALGDRVNLASRLEGATKLYQTNILASEATRQMAPELAWLEVDSVRVLGKTKAERVFTLAGAEAAAASGEFAALTAVHQRMLIAYRAGDFAAAASLANEAHNAAPPSLRGLYDFFEQRYYSLEQSCPGDWLPITNLDAK